MTDYTLPPLPFNDGVFKLAPFWRRESIEKHGQSCAESARAPLLARIAVLEAAYRGLDAYKRALSSRVGELEAQLAQAVDDAKRYRWLRNEANNAVASAPLVFMSDAFGVPCLTPEGGSILFGSELDIAVNAAMKESGDA